MRLPDRLKAAAERQARKDGLSLADATRFLLRAYADNEIEIRVEQQ